MKYFFAFFVLATVFVLSFLKLIGLGLPHFSEPIGSHAELFIEGTRLTLILTLYSGTLGLILGTVAGVSKHSKNFILSQVSGIYIWLFRGTPLLVQILFVYFALPTITPKLRLDEQMAAIIALALNVGAYNAEAIRGGLLALPKGQTEAAFSLGLSSFQTLLWVTLPQAFRIAVPPLVSNLVALLKDSSLASAIGLLELSLVGNRLAAESFQPVPAFLVVAGIYLVITTAVTLAMHPIENRLLKVAK